jgi:hypothetical protein
MMKGGHLLLWLLGMLVLRGELLCVAQSRSLDRQLFQAVATGTSVRLLLRMGAAPPLAQDNQRRTAMTFAKGSPHPDKVRLLMRAMAKAR